MKLSTQKSWGKNLYKDSDYGFYHYQRTHNGKRIAPKSLGIKDLNRAKEMRDLINNFVALHGEAPWQNNMDTEIKGVFIERFGICPWKTLNPEINEQDIVPKWYDVCQEWYSSKVATCEFSTLKTYRQILKRHFLNVFFKDKPINEIKKKDINRWLLKLEQRFSRRFKRHIHIRF